MPQVLIRDAQLGDAQTVVQLIRELADSDGEECPLTRDYAEFYLLQSESHVLLAQLDGQIVGLLSYSMHPNLYHASQTCMIDEFVVSAPFRSKGIGCSLLIEVLDRAKNSSCAEISVTTMPDNQRAIAFYRRNGLVDEAVYLEKHF